MKSFLLLLSSVSIFQHTFTEETVANLTCPEFKDIVIGSFFYMFSSRQAYTAADFYIATKDSEDGVKLGENNWDPLDSEAFDLLRKTYFIVHGYRANHKKEWIRDMKKKLLLTNDINLIVIDWSEGSKTWNYVNAVRRTYQVAKDIVKFLEDIKVKVSKLKKPGLKLWNNLYFIGHSLGAHISGQAGRLIREADASFKVARITGLDPAQPCFTQADQSMKLDKSDADFVDIIHTQTGNGNGINGLGLQDSIGHLDFYVNGGVSQPECERISSIYTVKIQKMICSHDMANIYYTESLVNYLSDNCKFSAYSWDGSYNDAMQILNKVDNENYCSNCPEMGINAINYRNNSGKYLVILSLKKPYCQFKKEDKAPLQKGFEDLKVKAGLFHDHIFTPEDMLNEWND